MNEMNFQHSTLNAQRSTFDGERISVLERWKLNVER
jgi:hypothetical protein